MNSEVLGMSAFVNMAFNVIGLVVLVKIMFDLWDLCTTTRLILQLTDELRHTLDPDSKPLPPVQWDGTDEALARQAYQKGAEGKR
jgi:hypothetical protein